MKNTHNRGLLASSLAISLLALPASGVDFDWAVAGPADWNDAANWNTGTVPSGGGGNFARVNNGGVAEITSNVPDVQDFFAGRGVGSTGTINHSAGTAVSNGWSFSGADGGSGNFNFSGTANFSADRFVVGQGSGGGVASIGNTNVSGGLLTSRGELHVGNEGGTGTMTITGGNVEAGNFIAVGRESGTGVINISGGRLATTNPTSDGFIVIGAAGTTPNGTLNISGTGVIEAVNNMVLAESAGATGVVNQSGGTVTLLDNVRRTDNKQASLEIDSAGGGLGSYNLSGGTLNTQTIEVGTGAFNMTGGILVTTTFEGNLAQNGGTLSPGASPGNTLINGDYTLAAGADMLFELEGLLAETEYDQVDVTGTITLEGNITLILDFTPEVGDEFIVIDNQGASLVSGTFAEGAAVSEGGIDFSINYAGGDGNDVVLTVIAIPEPSTSLLGFSALLALAARRRRA